MTQDSTATRMRELTPGDRPALESFACARFLEPWTRDVEESVRETVPDLIASGDAHSLGMFDGETLCSLIVWTERADMRWVSAVCATTTLCRGHGYARHLKGQLLLRAQDAGAISLTSHVDRRNTRMLDLNRSLGAQITMDPGDYEFRRCTFRLA